MHSAERSEANGLFIFHGKISVPKGRELHRCIVVQHHDTKVSGHASCFKTLELAACNYWWPQMSRFVSEYVKHCDLCNRTKPAHHTPISKLNPSVTPEECWDVLSIDFIIELPQAHGYDAIMVVVNLLSKHAHFIPMHTTVIAEGTMNLFLREVWKHHGMPQTTLSDHSSQFITEFTHELYRLLGISQVLLTFYHPQTNGQTEHVNQELEGYLQSFTNK